MKSNTMGLLNSEIHSNFEDIDSDRQKYQHTKWCAVIFLCTLKQGLQTFSCENLTQEPDLT